MKNNDRFSLIKLILGLIFLIIPVIAVQYELFGRLNTYLGYMGVLVFYQALAFAAGITGAYVLYGLRARFLITAPILLIVIYTGYKGLHHVYPGDFDSYFISVQYLFYAITFGLGWISGYGLVRYRYFPVLLTAAILTINLIILGKDTLVPDIDSYLFKFVPPLVLGLYLMYVRELIQSIQEYKFTHLLRPVVFLLFIGLMIWAARYLLDGDIKNADKALSNAKSQSDSKNNQNDPDDMMSKNGKDTTFNLKDYAELRSRLGRNQELLFCAHLDNYFDGTEIANPLYFASYYLTKYNPQKEVFELDVNMPSNDLFMPNPSVIPLYFSESDTAIITRSKGNKFRKIVEVDVYVNKLAPSAFTAPGAAFYCQPIAVEDDFKDQFKTAYKAKSYISLLNSAYFVYNVDNPDIKAFQQQRFNELRTVKNYDAVDKPFYNYYTFSPKGPVFDSIAQLAHQLTKGKKYPIDKVLAIRDYFLSKDAAGKPLFKYTLTPGGKDRQDMHGIQTTTNLSRFLFKTHLGYCTYFAGSTLYLLRSLNIPCRLTAGFMTVDRADKNPGWYWFYGDQAHAWIQVYFPGYGWLDFDTTIGAEESRESPKPDGTPPMQPQKAWFATTGKLVSFTDSTKKTAVIEIDELHYHERDFKAKQHQTIQIDLKHAKLKKNNAPARYKDMEEGVTILAISYDNKLSKIKPSKTETLDQILKRLPKPLGIDEFHLRPDEQVKKAPTLTESLQDPHTLKKIAWIAGSILLFVLLALVVLPQFTYWYLLSKVNKSGYPDNISNSYRLCMFLLTIYGFERKDLTVHEFAKNIVDPALKANFEVFINQYLAVKYSKAELSPADKGYAERYHTLFIPVIKAQMGAQNQLKAFISSRKTIRFLTGKY